MLKVKTPRGYPPEEGRYIRGNDYSPVAVCVILDNFDFQIPPELTEMVMAGIDAGAALAGTLQTENVGTEKMICNIVANPNIRYIILCGRESTGHLTGESLLALHKNGIDKNKQIIGTEAPTPYLYNLPLAAIQRFNEQIVSIVNLLCKQGERNLNAPGLNPEVIEKAVWSCIQEEPVKFMNYSLYDMGAYPEPAIYEKIEWKVTKISELGGKTEKPRVGTAILQKLLPGTNCKKCGMPTCFSFAFSLDKGKKILQDCPTLCEPEFAGEYKALSKLLE